MSSTGQQSSLLMTVKKRSTRKTKPTYTVNRKTLDTQHMEKMKEMSGRRDDIAVLKTELASLNQSLVVPDKNIDEIIGIKDRISDVRSQLAALKAKLDNVQYFSDTASILFRYYDLLDDSITPKMSPAPSQTVAAAAKSTASNKNSILQYFGAAIAMAPPPTSTNASANNVPPKEIIQDDEECEQQRGSLLDKYMECTDDNHVKTNMLPEQSSICPHCGNEDRMLMHNDGYVHCVKCHTIEYIIVDHDKPSYKDPPKEISYYAYKRLNHFNEWLNQIQGKETTDIPDEVFDRILLEIKKQKIDNIANLTPGGVRQILKKLKINKYYEHVPHIINRLNGIPMPHLSVELEDKLRNMFKQIQAPFLKFSPMDRKNFLSYSYVLHKFIQLLGHDEYIVNFPLLKSREKLHQQDQIWSKICGELNWQFIKSL